jgi:hypothetical protein
MTGRRRFLAKAGGLMAAAAASAAIDVPNVIAQPKVQWRMSTTWTPVVDVLQGAAQPGRGSTAGEGHRGNERRAVPDRGLPGRPDHAAARVFRCRLPGHHRGFHGRLILLDYEGASGRPGWQEPGAMTEFGYNKKAYDALPVDLQRTLDHAAAAVQVYAFTDYHARNAIALGAIHQLVAV